MTARPVGADEFAARMARLGPFEPEPRLAVAVSGGSDSLALALLADGWARARGGDVLALTVDHRLRPGSTAEADGVAAWAAGRGIAHRTLAWDDPKPAAGLQAAARDARYRLLLGACRARGILHLATAHQQEDQAETVLLRLGHASGLDGLAAMAPVVEAAEARLLRPLLEVPRARLAATLAAAGQAWVDDPSNRDARFQRARLRALAPALAAEGLTAAHLAASAARLGRARAALEQATATALAGAATLHPAGFALVDPALFRSGGAEMGLRALARLLICIGGAVYPPRQDRLERLFEALLSGLAGARTLAGCRMVPRAGRLLVCREPAAMAATEVGSGQTVDWDGRFRLSLGGRPGARWRLGPLGRGGWAAVGHELDRGLPDAVRVGLPALRDDDGVCVVPHLRYNRMGGEDVVRRIAFVPRTPLTAVGVRLA